MSLAVFLNQGTQVSEKVILQELIPVDITVGVSTISIVLHLTNSIIIPVDFEIGHYIKLREYLTPGSSSVTQQGAAMFTYNVSFSVILAAILWAFILVISTLLSVNDSGATFASPTWCGRFIKPILTALFTVLLISGVILLNTYMSLQELCLESSSWVVVVEDCKQGEIHQLLLLLPFISAISFVIEVLLICPASTCTRRRNSEVGLELSPSTTQTSLIRVGSLFDFGNRG